MDYKNRESIPLKYRWDLTKYFESDEAWENYFNEVAPHVSELKKYENKIFEKNNLYEMLTEYYAYYNKLENLYAYAVLKQDEDLGISKYNKMYQNIIALINEFETNTAFMIPEILHSEYFDIANLLAKNPKLKRYEHLLEELLIEKKHIKDAKTEEIISILTKDMNYYENFASSFLNSTLDYGKTPDEKGNLISLNTGNYRRFLASSNRDVRKKAYNKINKERLKFKDTMGRNLLSFMNRHVSIGKIRGYSSTKEMDFETDFVPIEVHEAILKNASYSLDLFQDYHRFLKNILKLDKLKPYDLGAPIVANKKSYSIEDAKNYIYEATKILGSDYSKRVEQAFNEKWIDFMPYKGKCSGGYCLSIYKKTPNILMSFNEEYDSVSTIAHELGHAINSTYTSEFNEAEYAFHSHYISEITSLFNETLLAEYVISSPKSTKEDKIAVINEMLKIINNNFFTALMENELEEIVYHRLDNDEVLTSNDLTAIMDSLIKKYFGDTLYYDDYYRNMWIRRSHYFTPWYLYKYATCICGAIYFASKILKGDMKTKEDYLEFLKTGSDKFPNDILLENGIDLTKSDIYEELFTYYSSLLDRLKKLVNGSDENE